MAVTLRCAPDFILPLPIIKLVVCGAIIAKTKPANPVPIGVPLVMARGDLITETYYFATFEELDKFFTFQTLGDMISRPIHHIKVYKGRDPGSIGMVVCLYDRSSVKNN